MISSIVEEDLKYITSSNLPWKEFKGKTILVSGANGFLPAYMVESLLYLNEIKNWYDIKVIGLVRNREKAKSRFSMYKDRVDLQLFVQDICKPLTIDEEVDFIIHAASQASPKFYGKDPVGTLCANTIGTNNLLSFARDNDVKGFLFFSSSEVYGQVKQSQMPIKEDSYGYIDPTDVRSCYAESKRMGETMCVSWFHQYCVPAKIVRPFHTYGPGMSLDDGRVYADFIADLLSCRDIVMNSDGSAVRSFCYLADAVLGFFTVLLNGQSGQAYNIGNDKCSISILQFANVIANLFPEMGLKVITPKMSRDPNYLPSLISISCPDVSKVHMLGWKPNYSLEQGLIRTMRWFEENKICRVKL
jgi:UDP-glucuronate decarboxylase